MQDRLVNRPHVKKLIITFTKDDTVPGGFILVILVVDESARLVVLKKLHEWAKDRDFVMTLEKIAMLTVDGLPAIAITGNHRLSSVKIIRMNLPDETEQDWDIIKNCQVMVCVDTPNHRQWCKLIAKRDNFNQEKHYQTPYLTRVRDQIEVQKQIDAAATIKEGNLIKSENFGELQGNLTKGNYAFIISAGVRGAKNEEFKKLILEILSKGFPQGKGTFKIPNSLGWMTAGQSLSTETWVHILDRILNGQMPYANLNNHVKGLKMTQRIMVAVSGYVLDSIPELELAGDDVSMSDVRAKYPALDDMFINQWMMQCRGMLDREPLPQALYDKVDVIIEQMNNKDKKDEMKMNALVSWVCWWVFGLQ
jgi:hypothetical protein